MTSAHDIPGDEPYHARPPETSPATEGNSAPEPTLKVRDDLTPPAAPAKTRWLTTHTKVAAATLMLLTLGVGVAFGAESMSNVLSAKAPTCPAMASAAASAPAGTQVDNVVIGVSSDSPAMAAAAESFVRSSLAGTSPTSAVLARITLVDGDSVSAGSCNESPLYVEPNPDDLANYAKANSSSRSQLATALDSEYKAAVDQVGSGVAATIRASAAPTSGDSGTVDVWSIAATLGPGRLYILDDFSVAGNNCLTFRDPLAQVSGGSSAVAARLEQCLLIGDLARLHASSVTLAAYQPPSATGADSQAQQAVMTALCKEATTSGCATSPSPND